MWVVKGKGDGADGSYRSAGHGHILERASAACRASPGMCASWHHHDEPQVSHTTLCT